MSKKSKKKKINSPYWFVITISLLLSAAIIVAAVKTSIIDAPHWNKKAEGIWKLGTTSEAVPQRGDILAHDGTPLAQTVALYTAFVDFKDPRIDEKIYSNIVYPKHEGKVDTLNLDALCAYLAKEFPVKSQKEYHDYILKMRSKKSSSCVLAEDVTDMQYKALQKFVISLRSKKSRTTGLTRLRAYKRFYPYDTLTSVVLGRATLATEEMLAKNPKYKNKEWHGSSGLELSMDSLLFGEYGKVERRQEYLGSGVYEVQAPVRGYDVVTTLDMTIQDIAERNLMHMVRSQRAQYGTAVVMEVATGEIRAMANVELNSEGKYTYKTRRNYAITAIEPGSVVKTLSMLIAMENSNINPLREFNSEGAIPEIGGYKKIGHYKNPLTVQEVIIKSDNRGICKIVGDVYRGRYNDFVYDIRKSGILQTASLPLPEAQAPHVQPMEFKKQWQYFSYAQMIFGYHNRFAPVSTLSVYNAIANNGRLMKPQLVKALMRDGVTDTVFSAECINENFCTPEHAKQLREMLYGVVNTPAGTANVIQKGRVVIAGKTGTAKATVEKHYTDSKGRIRYREDYIEGIWRLAFAGFFPYENPQYSCIVVIDKPLVHKASSGGVAGGVFRAIVEEMYSRNLLDCEVDYKENSDVKTPPRNYVTSHKDELVYEYLNQHPIPDTIARSTSTFSLQDSDVVPSVIGWSAQEALYELECRGCEVEIEGVGRVAKQSPAAGLPLREGMKITLTLK